MNLIDKTDLVNVNGIKSQRVNSMLMNTLKINRLNEVYAHHIHSKGVDFIDAVLKDLQINIQISESDLKRIPQSGSFITISNHPFGGIDGLVLLSLLSKVRPDYKVMANYLLQRIEPIKEIVLPVNPFENHKDSKSSTTGLKQAFTHLDKGCPIGIFPAGEVSSIGERVIQDRQWSTGALKFIRNNFV